MKANPNTQAVNSNQTLRSLRTGSMPKFGQQVSSLYGNSLFLEMLQIYGCLVRELFVNRYLVEGYIQRLELAPDSSESQNAEAYDAAIQNDDYVQSMKKNEEENKQKCTTPSRYQKKFKESSEQSYKPGGQHDQSPESPELEAEYSKSIPKNFRRNLLRFIQRQERYVRSVLERLSISKEQFRESLDLHRRKMGSLAQLRAFWSNSQNRCAKACRIISIEYLRKHNLGYIFNSKVKHWLKHLKRRQIIMQAVANPAQMTSQAEL